MPRFAFRNCRGCGRSSDEVGPLSWTRQCAECGTRNLLENIDGLVTMSGEPLKRWRQGMAAAVGAVLLDDVTPSEHTSPDA